MAKRILVPLKQRSPAASFMTALRDLAQGAGATVRLLHVAPPTTNLLDAEGRIVAYADQETARVEAEARDFLETMTLDLDGLPVELAVRFGDPEREILSEAAEFGADLILLAIGPHMPRSLRRHVAERVFRGSEVPVALLRPARHEADAR